MHPTLTPKQQEVFDYLKMGMTNKQIAKRMGLAESTVKLHVGNIYKAYAVRNRAALMVSAYKGLTPEQIPAPEKSDPVVFGWVLVKNTGLAGFVIGKEQPDERWQAVYPKA